MILLIAIPSLRYFESIESTGKLILIILIVIGGPIFGFIFSVLNIYGFIVFKGEIFLILSIISCLWFTYSMYLWLFKGFVI